MKSLLRLIFSLPLKGLCGIYVRYVRREVFSPYRPMNESRHVQRVLVLAVTSVADPDSIGSLDPDPDP